MEIKEQRKQTIAQSTYCTLGLYEEKKCLDITHVSIELFGALLLTMPFFLLAIQYAKTFFCPYKEHKCGSL